MFIHTLCHILLELIDSNQCAGNEAEVVARIQFLKDHWEDLMSKTHQKTLKLKEAHQEQLFNTGIKDMEFWLAEVR